MTTQSRWGVILPDVAVVCRRHDNGHVEAVTVLIKLLVVDLWWDHGVWGSVEIYAHNNMLDAYNMLVIC